MNDCDARCGYCGRCETSDEDPTSPDLFECLWCEMACEDDTYYPYCGPLCGVQAERHSEEDQEGTP